MKIIDVGHSVILEDLTTSIAIEKPDFMSFKTPSEFTDWEFQKVWNRDDFFPKEIQLLEQVMGKEFADAFYTRKYVLVVQEGMKNLKEIIENNQKLLEEMEKFLKNPSLEQSDLINRAFFYSVS